MNQIEIALYSTLTAGTALTSMLAGARSIYNGIIPDGVGLPAVVFSQQSHITENTDPHTRENALYLVKGISETSMGNAGTIDARIRTLLHAQTLSVSGYTNFWTRRESSIRYVEMDAGGKRIYHSGGIYRIRLTEP